MKIAVLSDGFPPHYRGGAEAVAQRIANEYVRQGHSVVAITSVQATEDVGREESDGLTIRRVYASYHPRWAAYRGLYNPQTVSQVARALKDEGPDIVHVHNIHRYLSYHCLKVASALGIPALLTFHDTMSFDYGKSTQFVDPNDLSDQPSASYKISPLPTLAANRLRYFPLRNLVIRYYLRRYTKKTFAVSDELNRALRANGITCAGTIHNGIDPGHFTTTEREVGVFADKHQIRGKKAILFGGRLSHLKGGTQIMQAMSRINAEIPEAVLLLLGHDEEHVAMMHTVAKQAGLGAQVVPVGWLTGRELRAAYGASQVVVVPSIYLDPFPTINIEAMAMSKPVVGTVFGGTKEIVVDGETGYVVNPLNVERLASRIVELLSNEPKARAMGEAGYRRVIDEFTIQKCASRYLSVSDGLLEKRAAIAGSS